MTTGEVIGRWLPVALSVGFILVIGARMLRSWRRHRAYVLSDRKALTLANGVEVREVHRVNGRIEYVLTERAGSVARDVTLSYEAADTLVWFLSMRFGKLPNLPDGSYR